MPPRDRLWMCPNHVEHFLDLNLLGSTRLTERIKLWQKYSTSQLDSAVVKLDFLAKCQNSRNMPPDSEHHKRTLNFYNQTQSPVKRCKVPETVRLMYRIRKSSNDSRLDRRLIEECEEEEDEEVNSESIESLERTAIEALGLLSSQGSAGVTVPEQTVTMETASITAVPPLFKHCKESIRPRALLQYLPQSLIKVYNSTRAISRHHLDLFLMNLLNENSLPSPHHIPYRSLTIGSASNMDICLSRMELRNKSADQIRVDKKYCKFISDKHACIYYDDQTNNYELINFSEHGTIVDNCYYGIDLGDLSELNDEMEGAYIEKHAMSSHKQTNGSESCSLLDSLLRACPCDTKQQPSNGYEKYKAVWEGPAVLSHGSHLKIGCYDFLFVIVDYDFVDRIKNNQAHLIHNLTRDKINQIKSMIGSEKKAVLSSKQTVQQPTAKQHQSLLKRLKSSHKTLQNTSNSNGNGSEKSRSKKESLSRLKKLRHKKPATKNQNKTDKLDHLISLISNENKICLLNN